MADYTLWSDDAKRAAFVARGQQVFEQIKGQLKGQAGVVAIEPESGEYFVGNTLGKADAAAYAKFPDTWVYFVRLDDPSAAIPLPTW